MKTFLILICIVTGALDAQVKDNGIYLSGADFIQRKLEVPFNKNEGFRFRSFDDVLINVKAPDTIYTYFNIDIWGYRKERIDWPMFNAEFFKVNYVGEICIYTVPGAESLDIGDGIYFSVGITSPIYEVSRKNLMAAYHKDTAFVHKIKSLPITTSIFKWDKQKHRYQFINWLSSQSIKDIDKNAE